MILPQAFLAFALTTATAINAAPLLRSSALPFKQIVLFGQAEFGAQFTTLEEALDNTRSHSSWQQIASILSLPLVDYSLAGCVSHLAKNIREKSLIWISKQLQRTMF